MAASSGSEYEDEHASCSVLLAKIRNEDSLLCLPPHDQFRWLHRFYLVLDRIAEQHRVYKLYGGPHGFMISTGVAEADADHAATLLRFSLHLLQAAQSVSAAAAGAALIRLAGSVPLDLVMVMASGPATSGLLGTTSLTYQIVGRCVSVAREVMETQQKVPFIVTSGMYDSLDPSVAGELTVLGSMPLRCCPGEQEQLYSLPRYTALPMSKLRLEEGPHPFHVAAGVGGDAKLSKSPEGAAAAEQQPKQQQWAARATYTYVAGVAKTVAAAPAGGYAAAVAGAGGTGLAGRQALAEQAEVEAAGAPAPAHIAASLAAAAKLQPPAGVTVTREGSLPYNQASSDAWLEADLLLRFEDAHLEAAFARFNNEAQHRGELAWLMLGLLTAALYAVAWTSPAISPLRLLQFQLLPALGALACRYRHETYLRYREALWFVQRLLLLLSTSLPGCFAFAHASTTPMFAFGLCNIGLEVFTRRLRLHLQLLNSLLIYAITLSLMSLHPEGSPGRTLITPAYLSLHLAITVLAPVLVAGGCDYMTRLAFQAQMQRAGLLTPAKPKQQ
ncbi:expressed protein [Chlorella variabilis]|uniref:Expressed protein n=1 Tax=Chlorella variabilis TaxID=554065 RepID=E1ZFC6_CHLVA|nr:expressed protein [Chlorella variabilis]EFN55643.1 expressed protein [Chlorella variabilis]|eukprot:XP_005847745.1 expressed protein [Chlorella variabilis]